MRSSRRPSRVTVPRIFDSQVPDQRRGVSCRQVSPGPSSRSGSGVCQAYWSRASHHAPRLSRSRTSRCRHGPPVSRSQPRRPRSPTVRLTGGGFVQSSQLLTRAPETRGRRGRTGSLPPPRPPSQRTGSFHGGHLPPPLLRCDHRPQIIRPPQRPRASVVIQRRLPRALLSLGLAGGLLERPGMGPEPDLVDHHRRRRDRVAARPGPLRCVSGLARGRVVGGARTACSATSFVVKVPSIARW